MGLIKRSGTGLLDTILGRKVRNPGEYHLTDATTGQPTKDLLQDTRESIHPSVGYRMQNGGRAPANAAEDTLGPSAYQPLALKGWDYVPGGKDTPAGIEVDGRWAKVPKWVNKSTGTYIC